MSRFRLLAVGVLLSLLAVDTVSAGLFGLGRRRWERRKSELRAELVYNLEHKLDQDLAREVETMTAELSAVAEAQVKSEAAKLEQQVQQALVQLREEASKIVANEAKRLDQEINKQVTNLQKQTEELVATQAAELKKQADQELTMLTVKFAEHSKALQGKFDQEVAQLPGRISQQIEKSLEQHEAKKTAAEAADAPQDDETPTDDKTKVSATPATALPSKEVELTVLSSDDSSE